MVLLVVDTQKLLVNSKLYNFENFVTNIRELINTSRKNNIEVLYVIHDDGLESDLTKGKDGFEVYNIIGGVYYYMEEKEQNKSED